MALSNKSSVINVIPHVIEMVIAALTCWSEDCNALWSMCEGRGWVGCIGFQNISCEIEMIILPLFDKAHQPGGHYWDYYPDALSSGQVTTLLKIKYLIMLNFKWLYLMLNYLQWLHKDETDYTLWFSHWLTNGSLIERYRFRQNADCISIYWATAANLHDFYHGERYHDKTIDKWHDPIADTAKLTGPRTLTDKRWVGPVKLLCIIMFDISKIRPKSIFGPVKAQKFSWCLL